MITYYVYIYINNNNIFDQLECGGMIMEECPHKMAESFRLFLQGMGYS